MVIRLELCYDPRDHCHSIKRSPSPPTPLLCNPASSFCFVLVTKVLLSFFQTVFVLISSIFLFFVHDNYANWSISFSLLFFVSLYYKKFSLAFFLQSHHGIRCFCSHYLAAEQGSAASLCTSLQPSHHITPILWSGGISACLTRCSK